MEDLAYCHEATAWAEAHFDETYRARWTPGARPALVLGGEQDHVVDQSLWRADASYGRPQVLQRTIAGAGHFPWIENPAAVRDAFADFVEALERAAHHQGPA
jgi:pimeloyl-ACP methyl ester carboxylesterase